jgi:hypothetical protein
MVKLELSRKQMLAVGILGLLVLGFVFTPLGEQGAAWTYKARAYFQGGDEEPGDDVFSTITIPTVVTITEPQTVVVSPPPSTVTVIATEETTLTEPYTITRVVPVTATETIIPPVTQRVAGGYVDVTGGMGFYDDRNQLVYAQYFSVADIDIDHYLATFTQIRIVGDNLLKDDWRVLCYVKIDLPDGTGVTIDRSDSIYPGSFNVVGDNEHWEATSIRTPVWDSEESLREAANKAGLDYHIDELRWHFRVKVKVYARSAITGEELIAAVHKSFVIETDYCRGCGGILRLWNTESYTGTFVERNLGTRTITSTQPLMTTTGPGAIYTPPPQPITTTEYTTPPVYTATYTGVPIITITGWQTTTTPQCAAWEYWREDLGACWSPMGMSTVGGGMGILGIPIAYVILAVIAVGLLLRRRQTKKKRR